MPVMHADRRVEFEGAEPLRRHFDSHLGQGALLVKTQEQLRAFSDHTVTLLHPASPALTLTVRVQVIAHPGDEVLLRLSDFGPKLRAELEGFVRGPAPVEAPPPQPAAPSPGRAEASPPPAATAPAATAPAATAPELPLSGPFRNPATPPEFLDQHRLRERSRSHPSMMMVMMSVAQRRAERVRLEVRSGPSRFIEAYVLGGVSLEARIPIPTVLACLASSDGTYEVDLDPPAPDFLRYSTTLSLLQIELLKELVKQYPEEDLAASMTARMGMSPKLNANGYRALLRLNLSASQTRVGKRMLDGTFALDEVLNSGIGVRSTYRLLYLLEVSGGLTWVEPPPASNLAVDELKATYERLRRADYFSVLGLHYSSPPRLIDVAFKRLERMYAPGGDAARESPAIAEELHKRVQAAHAALRTEEDRKAYRLKAFPGMRLDYSADLTLDQARLAAMRHEWELATDLLEITIELHPTKEAFEELKNARVRRNEAERAAARRSPSKA